MDETITVHVASDHGSEPEPVEIPARVGHVRLESLLGEGSGGVVLLGYDEVLKRRVAVKVLHRRRASADAPASVGLIDGVRGAARIRHPNVLTVYAAEIVRGLPVIVMEYVDGISLRRLLNHSGALPLALAACVMRGVLDGACALHEADIIHRDLKPANILFDRDGGARVCDFGLACAFDRSAYRASASGVGGTPLYMAPECFDGHVSPQSDVYALGIMLFELLTGGVPYQGATLADVIAQHRRGDVPLDRLARHGAPAELVDVVARALHRKRFLRYKSALHLRRALRDCLPPDVPDESQRLRLGRMISSILDPTAALPASRPGEPPARTTFDLIARRVQQKRGEHRA